MRRLFLIAALLFSATAMHVSAQQCDLLHSGTLDATNRGLPNQVVVIKGGGEFLCPGKKHISAEEIGATEINGMITLNKNVHYSDSTKIVTGDFGQYNKRTGLLHMTGNVVVTDIKTGSKVFAPVLDYTQGTGANKQQLGHAVTSGGRAHVIMKQAAKPGAPITEGNDSSIVDADIVEITADSTFRGTGSAVIIRTDMRGYGNMVEYDQKHGNMLLAQAARIEGDKYRLQADTIRAIAEQGQQIKEVRALWNSTLTSDQVTVESPFLHIYLDSGNVNRLVATRPLAKGNQPVSLPRVLSAQFNVSADSIDALAPKQVLQTVDAVGHAYGERIDTAAPPAVAKEMPQVLTHDWLRGDTLHAVFIQNPDPKPLAAGATQAARDSATKNDRVLQQIVALGNTASSAIRRQDPKDATWKIYYNLANRITVDFVKGAVANVDLRGNVHGLFLTPLNQAATPAKKPKGGQ